MNIPIESAHYKRPKTPEGISIDGLFINIDARESIQFLIIHLVFPNINDLNHIEYLDPGGPLGGKDNILVKGIGPKMFNKANLNYLELANLDPEPYRFLFLALYKYQRKETVKKILAQQHAHFHKGEKLKNRVLAKIGLVSGLLANQHHVLCTATIRSVYPFNLSCCRSRA